MHSNAFQGPQFQRLGVLHDRSVDFERILQGQKERFVAPGNTQLVLDIDDCRPWPRRCQNTPKLESCTGAVEEDLWA